MKKLTTRDKIIRNLKAKVCLNSLEKTLNFLPDHTREHQKVERAIKSLKKEMEKWN